METKQVEASCEQVKREVGMENAEYVLPSGLIGGLALWWTRDVTVSIIIKDRNFVDCNVTRNGSGNVFYATCVYGDPDFSTRALLWDTI